VLISSASVLLVQDDAEVSSMATKPSGTGFFRYYWMFIRHFARECYTHGGLKCFRR